MKLSKFDIFFLLKWFFIWRLFLQLAVVSSSFFLKTRLNFLGGEELYFSIPSFWAWGNFDGQHYSSIALNGYRHLQYYYFPDYPLLMHLVSSLMGKNIFTVNLAGMIISHIAFIIALFGFYLLVKDKFTHKLARLSTLILLAFPTSFYFAGVYTESLFLMFVVWTFYFATQKKWLFSGISGYFANLTRTIGVPLFIAISAEEILRFIRLKKNKLKFLLKRLPILIMPLGLATYMLYMNSRIGDPLEFTQNGYVFGEYRSDKPIFLPIVFYRYFFKILPNQNWLYFPRTFTTLLEFLSGLILLVFSITSWIFLPISWWLYGVGAYIIPTMYNNFSSLPRYALVVFPLFIFIAKVLERRKIIFKFFYFIASVLILCISTMLFSQGYWVS